jgi:hypothetical protein
LLLLAGISKAVLGAFYKFVAERAVARKVRSASSTMSIVGPCCTYCQPLLLAALHLLAPALSLVHHQTLHPFHGVPWCNTTQVEATKFTELGFVGRDVDEIVKDLMEASLALTKQRLAAGLRAAAGSVVEQLLLQALLGPAADKAAYDAFRCAGCADGVRVC